MKKINEFFSGVKGYLKSHKTAIISTGATIAIAGSLTAGVIYGEDIKDKINSVGTSITTTYTDTKKSITDTINDDPSELLDDTKSLRNDWKKSLDYFSGDINNGEYVSAVEESKTIVKEILGYLESISDEKSAGENLSEDNKDVSCLIEMFKKSESYFNADDSQSLSDHLGKSLDALSSYLRNPGGDQYCNSFSELGNKASTLNETLSEVCGVSLAKELEKEVCPPCPEKVCPEKECYLENIDDLNPEALVKLRRDVDGKLDKNSLDELLSIDASASSLDSKGAFNRELFKEVYKNDKGLALTLISDYINELPEKEKLEQTSKIIDTLSMRNEDKLFNEIVRKKELDFWLDALEDNYGFVAPQEPEPVEEEELKYELQDDTEIDEEVPQPEIKTENVEDTLTQFSRIGKVGMGLTRPLMKK